MGTMEGVPGTNRPLTMRTLPWASSASGNLSAMAHDVVSELKYFEAYLASGRAPRWTMAISDLHGFLTGIAMGGAVAEDEWLPLIWSGEQPEFVCEEEEQSVLGELRALHGAITADLASAEEEIVPVLLADENGNYDASDWADGFLQAIETNPEPWRKAFDCAKDSLGVVLATCHENHEGGQAELLGPDDTDMMVSHLRQLHCVMRGAADAAAPAAKAA
jgi:yecA family protein